MSWRVLPDYGLLWRTCACLTRAFFLLLLSHLIKTLSLLLFAHISNKLKRVKIISNKLKHVKITRLNNSTTTTSLKTDRQTDRQTHTRTGNFTYKRTTGSESIVHNHWLTHTHYLRLSSLFLIMLLIWVSEGVRIISSLFFSLSLVMVRVQKILMHCCMCQGCYILCMYMSVDYPYLAT